MSKTCDIHQASELLKIHWQTVLDLINKGFIPAAKIGRAWVMLENDVLDYLVKEVSHQTSLRLGSGGQPRPKKTRRKASINEHHANI